MAARAAGAVRERAGSDGARRARSPRARSAGRCRRVARACPATGTSRSGRWRAANGSCRSRPVPDAPPKGTPVARAADRRAEHRRRLPLPGAHAGPPSAGAAARGAGRGGHRDRGATLRELPHGRVVRVAGIVTARQRPQSAGGVMFVTLEDETGYVNLIVWETVWSRARRVASNRGCWRCTGCCRRKAG